MKRAVRVLKPYLFVLPMLACAIGFTYYPFLKNALYSVSKVNFMGQITGGAGLDNYRYLFSRRDFSIALTNTAKLAAMNVPITVLLTMALALLACKRRRFSPIYETLYALPMAVSMSASALLFKSLLHPTVGLVNYVTGLTVGWLEDKTWAMYGILLLTVWMGIGFNYLLFLAAFRAVPKSLMEAATIDGADAFRQLVHVRLPAVAPTTAYIAGTNLILALLTSGPVILLTQGGPARSTTTLVYMMYASGYGSSNYGLAACLSILVFAISFLAMLGVLAFARGRAPHL